MAGSQQRHPQHAASSGATTRRSFLKRAFGTTVVLVAAACAPSPSPTPAATSAAPSTPGAKTSSATGAGGDFQKQWDELIAAAKQEGKLVVAAAPVPVVRTGILDVFSKKFGVQAEYLGALGSEHANRLTAERSANQYNLDLWISGQVILYPAYNRGWLDPIKPLLIHPEATGSNWSCVGCDTPGPLPFMDPKNEAILRPVNYTSPAAIYNTKMVKPEELKTFQDLLDPKWKGKIAAYDPVNSAPGQTIARFWWKALGDDFVRKFFQEQQPALTDSNKQLEEWVSRGVYPIVQNLDTDQIERLKKDALPVDVIEQLGGAPSGYVNYVWAAGFMVGLLNKAPHSNAAKLFLNWLGTKEGIETYARALNVPASRTDVANDWVPSYVKPKKDAKYFDVQGWNEFSQAQQESAQLKALVAKP